MLSYAFIICPYFRFDYNVQVTNLSSLSLFSLLPVDDSEDEAPAPKKPAKKKGMSFYFFAAFISFLIIMLTCDLHHSIAPLPVDDSDEEEAKPAKKSSKKKDGMYNCDEYILLVRFLSPLTITLSFPHLSFVFRRL